MRTPLMIGLAAVLGATLWLSSQDEGDGGADAVEVVTSRRPADAAPTTATANAIFKGWRISGSGPVATTARR